MITATRYHDISCGHRVCGHESKCASLHGHNYRFHFTIAGELDNLGRVLDFGVIKSRLCQWLEDNYDHKFLLWESDPVLKPIQEIDPAGVVAVPFNPTAENIAKYMVKVVAPKALVDTGATLIKCTVEETRKCSASYEVKSI